MDEHYLALEEEIKQKIATLKKDAAAGMDRGEYSARFNHILSLQNALTTMFLKNISKKLSCMETELNEDSIIFSL